MRLAQSLSIGSDYNGSGSSNSVEEMWTSIAVGCVGVAKVKKSDEKVEDLGFVAFFRWKIVGLIEEKEILSYFF
jgi:hypothetical protein